MNNRIDNNGIKWIFCSLLIGLAGCGGGGGGSTPPSPSLSSNMPASAFDDETIVVTVTARNFGSGGITYNATSNSLSIQQGNADNQFVITGVSSVPGNHTISFSASDTSGKSATLNSSIRINVVATGWWSTTSLSVDGVAVDDVSAEGLVTREGRVYLGSSTNGIWGEKCLGSSSTSAATLTFEVWCAGAPDGYQVTDENYRITGELEINRSIALGTYSVYESSGALLGTVDVDMERRDPYQEVGQPAPTSPRGVYVGIEEANILELITVDSSGDIAPNVPGGNCDVDGSVASVNINLDEGNDYVSRGIFDVMPISQTGCVNPSGNLSTGNRDIVAGEGILQFIPGAWYGLPREDEVLLIQLSDSVSSYGGIPSSLLYFRVCSASGDATPFADFWGFADQCSGQ